MAHQVVWDKMALQNEDGTDTILRRGQMLPTKGVDEFQLGVLTSIGAVRFMEDIPSDVDYSAVAMDPDQDKGRPSAPPAGLPPSYSAGGQTPEGNPAREPGTEPDPDPDTNPEDVPPANSAPKGEWVAYAVRQGLSEPEANRLSKEALINRYGR